MMRDADPDCSAVIEKEAHPSISFQALRRCFAENDIPIPIHVALPVD